MILKAADLFCGAGGTSTGLIDACREIGYEVELTAINHWDLAVATHTANHPGARHLCANLDTINPRDLYAEGELDLLWASPECTHHSVARGGRPMNDQSRATAWCVVRWAEALRPRVILVENVKEFQTWGPIGTRRRPLKSKRGNTFRAWVAALESTGYRVDVKILCAADYGDPTTRKRLFVQAVRGRMPLRWPVATHAPIANGKQAWVPAREIIDWTHQGASIFSRKRPLAPKTMRRIMVGLEKFGLAPFILPQHRGYDGKLVDSIERPMRAITTTARGNMLCKPFLLPVEGVYRGNAPRSVDEPLNTVTSRGAAAVVQPYLVAYHGARHENESRGHSIDVPLPTVDTQPRFGLVQPFIIGIDHRGGNGHHVRGINDPLSAVTTKQRHALVHPYLVKFYGSGTAASVDDPLDTVTSKHRFGLAQPTVEIEGQRYMLDILFRMLQPGELAAAQGFPVGYKFNGNKSDVIKQIGNAVPCRLAKAIAKEALGNLLSAAAEARR